MVAVPILDLTSLPEVPGDPLVDERVAYAVLPISACSEEIRSGRVRFAPVVEPAMTHQLGVAATAQLDLPREFSARIGDTIREVVAGLVESGRWPARFRPGQTWNPASGRP